MKKSCFGNYLSDFILGLFSRGVDLHVGQPDYRRVFSTASREAIPNLPSIGSRMINLRKIISQVF